MQKEGDLDGSVPVTEKYRRKVNWIEVFETLKNVELQKLERDASCLTTLYPFSHIQHQVMNCIEILLASCNYLCS